MSTWDWMPRSLHAQGHVTCQMGVDPDTAAAEHAAGVIEQEIGMRGVLREIPLERRKFEVVQPQLVPQILQFAVAGGFAVHAVSGCARRREAAGWSYGRCRFRPSGSLRPSCRPPEWCRPLSALPSRLPTRHIRQPPKGSRASWLQSTGISVPFCWATPEDSLAFLGLKFLAIDFYSDRHRASPIVPGAAVRRQNCPGRISPA